MTSLVKVQSIAVLHFLLKNALVLQFKEKSPRLERGESGPIFYAFHLFLLFLEILQVPYYRRIAWAILFICHLSDSGRTM